MADIDLTPTEEMASNAARGLELREKHGVGGTAVGVARARDLKNRKTLSPETVRRMHSFFSRHEKNKAGGEDDAGYIAWLLWGGDAGQGWAKRKVDQMNKQENAMSDTYKAIAERLKSAATHDRPGAKAKFDKSAAKALWVEMFNFWDRNRADDIVRLIPKIKTMIQKARSMPDYRMLKDGKTFGPSLHQLADEHEDAINERFSRPGEKFVSQAPSTAELERLFAKFQDSQRLFTPNKYHDSDERKRVQSGAKQDIRFFNELIKAVKANDGAKAKEILARGDKVLKAYFVPTEIKNWAGQYMRPGAKAKMARPSKPKRVFPNKESQAKAYADEIAQLRMDIKGKAGADAVEVLLKKAEKQLAVLNIPVAGDLYADAVRAAYAHGIFKGARPGAKVRAALADACWEGYEAVGMKQKDGKTVPNCVPKRKNAVRQGAKVSATDDAVSRRGEL